MQKVGYVTAVTLIDSTLTTCNRQILGSCVTSERRSDITEQYHCLDAFFVGLGPSLKHMHNSLEQVRLVLDR